MGSSVMKFERHVVHCIARPWLNRRTHMTRFALLTSAKTVMISAMFALSACSPGSLISRSDGGIVDGESTEPIELTCPGENPDCVFSTDPQACKECPNYWVCEDSPKGRRCVNPGPDMPDEGEWNCGDEEGTTRCDGARLPDAGSSAEWDCREGEFGVTCTDASPRYPDDGGSALWDCYFSGEMRICDSAPADEDGWICVVVDGHRECRLFDPELPDDRKWTCDDVNGTTSCATPGPMPGPGAAEGWDCRNSGELTICDDAQPSYPGDGGPGEWSCDTGDEMRLCEELDEPPSPPGSTPPICTSGTQRWCDDAIYCSWGKQTCLSTGKWGPCIEPTITPTGLADRPNNACACVNFFFNEACCEDQADRDNDGHPDCTIPAGHRPPNCWGL